MSEVEVLEREIAALRQQLEDKQNALSALRSAANEAKQSTSDTSKQKLTNEEIGRYARQIILPEVGVKGQLALKNASILIVGAGGLGMFAACTLHAIPSCSQWFHSRLFRLSLGTVFVWRWHRSHWNRRLRHSRDE